MFGKHRGTGGFCQSFELLEAIGQRHSVPARRQFDATRHYLIVGVLVDSTKHRWSPDGKDILGEQWRRNFIAYVKLLSRHVRENLKVLRLDRLGEAGRKAVHNNYSHWSVGVRLEEIVRRAAGETVPQT